MDDEAQAETEAETDTEAPSDGCRRHRIIRSRAGSQQQQLTPGEREAKQKADRAEWNTKSNAKRKVALDAQKAEEKVRFKLKLDAGAAQFRKDFFGTAACSSADAPARAGWHGSRAAQEPRRALSGRVWPAARQRRCVCASAAKP